MITKTAWFGPKTRLGWGWRPIRWQGWLVVVAFVAAITAAAMLPSVGHRLVLVAGLAAGLIVVCALTGTRPGGRL